MESGERPHLRGMTLDALRHPVRVRIVEACTDWGTLSPVEMVNRGLCADIATLRAKTAKQQLSNIAYHCRELAKAGLLTMVSERQVRGATEHFYRANSEAVFDDDEWARLTDGERRDISRVMWQRYIAQVESAMHQHTFDAHTDRWLAWGPLTLDPQGWKELTAAVSACYDAIERIRRDAEARPTGPAARPMRATYGLFAFESPPRESGDAPVDGD